MVTAEQGSLKRQGGGGGGIPEVSVGVGRWSRREKGVSPAERTTSIGAHRVDSLVSTNDCSVLGAKGLRDRKDKIESS